MKKNTLKTVILSVFTLFSLFLPAQDAPPSDGIFRLQNVETGEFLTAAGGSTQPVTMSASGEAQNTHWTFVESGDYYNIDSESETGGTGILRAPGAGGPAGPYVVVSTLKAPPAADTDKTWTIYYNDTTDTYRFESRTAGRYLYHEATGEVTHKPADETDNRSNWKLIPLVQTPVGVPINFQNVETGEFLTAAGGSTQPVSMSASGEAENTHWTLVESGEYYNIDSESETGGTGILRAPGAGGPGGPYVVVSTLKAPPAADTDKTWTIHYNATTDTYRFESRTAGRYLYHEATGEVTHKPAEETDNRSNWKLIPVVETPVGGAPDEDTGPYTTCNPEGQNATRTSSDLPNPVNVGTIDDRSCYADYKESNVYGKTWGVYNITSGSNHLDAPNTLQPRIERTLSRSQEVGVGSYARFTGIVRILEVGDTTGDNNDGTYIMQAKGKHIGEGGPPDPAICLYLAKPVYGPDSSGNQVQVSFDLYREQINYRGGSGSGGRQIVYLTNIPKDVETNIELEVGFREDPNDSTKKIHYADAVIGDSAYNWNIPEPGRGTESGIRYGVYRVKGGRAQIRWANTTYEKVEKVGTTDPVPPTEIYRIKNVATGKYLMSSDDKIIASDSGEGADKEWQFVKAGVPGFDYYNIDSEVRGIIRFKGGASDAELISTNFTAPNTDVDKLWDLIEHTDGSYSFETRDKERYLYHAEDNTMTHSDSLNDRSKWILESTTVSIEDRDLESNSINIYPNPAEDAFTIDLKNIRNAKVRIIDMLGKVIYQTNTKDGSIQLSKADGFSTGLYIIQVSDENGRKINKKLLME